MKFSTILVSVLLLAIPFTSKAGSVNGFDMSVVVNGSALDELYGRNATYVEALRNRDYVIQLSNPLPVRVAVALAVDGHNTIDAKRTSAWNASKWVLEPYETITIPGWQVDGSTARRFTFTTERRSYAAWLGDTDNLGVIEAVFYREKARPCVWCERVPMGRLDGAPAPSSAAPRSEQKSGSLAQPQAEAGGYAATGMGDATSNEIYSVHMELEREPAARVRIRYEFREQLVAMGLLPRPGERPPMRRERASGFSGYCPQPD